MSEVFSGVVIAVPLERVKMEYSDVFAHQILHTGSIPVGLTLISYKPERNNIDRKKVYELAMLFSKKLGKTLAIYYDSRIGLRASDYFSNGEHIRSFGQNDELYVQLDEDGEPNDLGKRFKYSELLPDDEYETIENAIELGLKELGQNKWTGLLSYISTQ
jgi:hypothetical protein